MKKKLALALSIIMACGMTLAGCNSSSTATTDAGTATDTTTASAETTESTAAASGDVKTGGMEGGTSLSFTTGGDQGTYYGFGGVLAGKVSESTSTTVTAITSGGSQANIEALDAGDAELGFVQSDVMSYAYEGTRLFEELGKMDGFSTARTFPSALQVPEHTSMLSMFSKHTDSVNPISTRLTSPSAIPQKPFRMARSTLHSSLQALRQLLLLPSQHPRK